MSTTQHRDEHRQLQQAARDHLWLHFTRMGGGEAPIIVRGDGCYLEDSNGKRYLDALAGLFAVQVGYSYGEEMGQAALEQMRELPFYTNWSYAHPRAIELAHEIAQLDARRPQPRLLRLRRLGGGRVGVEARAPVPRRARRAALEGGRPRASPTTARRWARSRSTASPRSARRSSRSCPTCSTCATRTATTGRRDETEEEFTAFLLEDLDSAIEQAGPETVAMVLMEPVQNAGGAFTPPAGYWKGVREICDKYGILLCADEVITGFGRLGSWFGSEHYDIKPDMITCAKGLSSAYASIGAVVASDRVVEPFLDDASMYTHGITFGGHPVQCAIALKNIEIMKRERIVENVRDNGDAFRATLAQLLDLPIVGDLRGTGFFYALELVKNKETRETFSDEECETLLRGFLSPQLFEKGLICRADDRGDPVIQISPPLIATQKEFDDHRRDHRGGAGRSMAAHAVGDRESPACDVATRG